MNPHDSIMLFTNVILFFLLPFLAHSPLNQMQCILFLAFCYANTCLMLLLMCEIGRLSAIRRTSPSLLSSCSGFISPLLCVCLCAGCRYEERTVKDGSFHTSTVRVVNVSASLDYTIFRCTARNSLGEDTLDIKLVSKSTSFFVHL